MILKGKNVVLRPVQMDDAPRFVKWFNDPDVHKFLNFRKFSLQQERQWIREKLKDKSGTTAHFSIDTSNGNHIGSIGLENINAHHKHASFGIMIGDKNFWNKGLGTEAAKLLLEYGFVHLKLHRIGLDVYEYNPRAIKVYKRLGFKGEGKKREHALWKGKFYDAIDMGLLETEWQKKNKKPVVMQWQ